MPRSRNNHTSANSTWNWASWTFTEFGCLVFVQYGNHFAGGGAYAYVVAHDGPSAYVTADRFILMRVPVGQIVDQAAWEFFSGTPTAPAWANRSSWKATFTSKGRCYRNGMSFDAARGPLPLVAAAVWKEPAGYPLLRWLRRLQCAKSLGLGEKADFPTKWMSDADMYLLFSGDDYFSVRKGTIVAGY